MNIPPVKREWNINTIISVFGFIILLGGLLWTTAQRDKDLTAVVESVAEFKVETNGRLAALEGLPRQIDNLAFRLGVAESSNAAIAKGLDELQAAVAQQSGDLRVVKEILQRIERQSSPASFTPLATLN